MVESLSSRSKIKNWSLSVLSSLILSSTILLSSSYNAIAGDTTVEAHVGSRYDLRLDTKLSSIEKQTNTDIIKNGAFTGVYVAHYTDTFNFNLLLTGSYNTSDGAELSAKSAALSFTPYSSIDDSAQITVGRIIIPFGIYETQRVIPSVVLPRTINDSIVGDILARGPIEPFREGLLLNYLNGNHSFTYSYYIPKKVNFNYTYTDYSRIKTEFDRFSNTIIFLPRVTIDPNNSDLSNGFDQPPTINELRSVTINKKTNFVSYTFENKKHLVDVEYAETYGQGNTSQTQNNRFRLKEQYFYIGTQKTFDKVTLLNEYLFIRNTIQSAKPNTNKTKSVSLIYDNNKYLYLGNYNVTNGDLMEAKDASIGFVTRLNNSSYIRLSYRKTSGTYYATTLDDTALSCARLSCYAVFDLEYYKNGFTGNFDSAGNSGITPMVVPIKLDMRGIEARFIYYF